ncbi:MAG: hypothetical protein HY455_01650 [Parcubacteria group bacterium]|nr:hypothetical protein [Parcubacteria group bacterium]
MRVLEHDFVSAPARQEGDYMSRRCRWVIEIREPLHRWHGPEWVHVVVAVMKVREQYERCVEESFDSVVSRDEGRGDETTECLSLDARQSVVGKVASDDVQGFPPRFPPFGGPGQLYHILHSLSINYATEKKLAGVSQVSVSGIHSRHDEAQSGSPRET